jgi:hypothetical protein
VKVRRWSIAVILPVVVITLLAFLPGVRFELRRSFTRLPNEYTELYFPKQPTATGSTVAVPVAVVHHGAAPRTYEIEVVLTPGKGIQAVTASKSVRAAPDEVTDTVLQLARPKKATTFLVTVTLADLPQSLHYRLSVKDAKDTP